MACTLLLRLQIRYFDFPSSDCCCQFDRTSNSISGCPGNTLTLWPLDQFDFSSSREMLPLMGDLINFLNGITDKIFGFLTSNTTVPIFLDFPRDRPQVARKISLLRFLMVSILPISILIRFLVFRRGHYSLNRFGFPAAREITWIQITHKVSIWSRQLCRWRY
ncbi:hypothetical protein BJ912DRAFT_468372 [Pholiota molesta]|nr:hypothetical protein BJ912DRAFT_468372 [Pholiota molesta]